MNNKENRKDSYFLISRLIFESAIWREDPHILKLFIWLIGSARHDKIPKKYPKISIQRGELVTSLAEISENNEYIYKNGIRKWSRAKVSRMLDKLFNEKYIEIVSDTYGTHIKICNYDIYQTPSKYKEDRSETGVKQECNRSATGASINNNVNKDNNVKNDKNVLEDKYSCTEPQKDVTPVLNENVFIKLPLNDKTEYPITERIINEMRELFPAVDVKQEFRAMRAWCDANSERRKTKRGIKRFYTNWLSRKQDKGNVDFRKDDKSQIGSIDSLKELAEDWGI